MRIPYFISIPTILITCIGTWWYGTHTYHFLTPPTPTSILEASKTTLIKPHRPIQEGRASEKLAIIVQPKDLETNSNTETELNNQLGDLNQPPKLDEYTTLAEKDPKLLTKVADRLEILGHSNRSLLAWERIFDTAKNLTPEQWQRAATGIRNLRGRVTTWNQNNQNTLQLQILIQANQASYTNAKNLSEKLRSNFQQASSGFIDFDLKLEKISSKQNHVTFTLLGSKRKKISTTFKQPLTDTTTDALCLQILQELAKPLATQPIHILHELAPQETGSLALQTHITRRAWLALAQHLQAPPIPKKTEKNH